MIRKAVLSDLDTIKNIAESCAKKMIANKIFQWNHNLYVLRRAYLSTKSDRCLEWYFLI